jgi:hypothetical protein
LPLRGENPPVELTGLSTNQPTLGPNIQEGLQQLARNRRVVLDAAGAIVMAHPFSAVPLGFSVMSVDTL